MNNKILVFTDKNLEGQTYMGYQIETTTKISTNLKTAATELFNTIVKYSGYILDNIWLESVDTEIGKKHFPTQFNFSTERVIQINVGSYSKFEDELRISVNPITTNEGVALHQISNDPIFDGKVIGIHYAVTNDIHTIESALEAWDLLYKEDPLKLLIGLDYEEMTDNDILEAKAFKTKTGNSLETYRKVSDKIKEKLEDDTIEIYVLLD